MTLGRLFDEPQGPVSQTPGLFLWLLPIEEADPNRIWAGS